MWVNLVYVLGRRTCQSPGRNRDHPSEEHVARGQGSEKTLKGCRLSDPGRI
jgi:hypothetical protein